ncbi:unnamed protein product, partial [Tetraodon nigroviridis]
RWEEQQKALALEQLCGVFRVDLGHMRSLRLFFSDDAGTSGQLVIASRESQYKILHFHHAGLDKLVDVFQQWRCCRETQPKDQVAAAGGARRGGSWFAAELCAETVAPASRCLRRNPACSSASRGPACPPPTPTQRRSFIAGWTSASGCATSTRAGEWRRSINYARPFSLAGSTLPSAGRCGPSSCTTTAMTPPPRRERPGGCRSAPTTRTSSREGMAGKTGGC